MYPFFFLISLLRQNLFQLKKLSAHQITKKRSFNFLYLLFLHFSQWRHLSDVIWLLSDLKINDRRSTVSNRRADVSYFLPPAEKRRLRNGVANRVPVSCCSGFKFRINYDDRVLFSVPEPFPSDRSKIGGWTGPRGGIWIFLTEALRTAFTGVDVTSELSSFDERSTDSSKRIRFSGEAEVPTLSFPSVSIFFFLL